jgi:hypothetical protein
MESFVTSGNSLSRRTAFGDGGTRGSSRAWDPGTAWNLLSWHGSSGDMAGGSPYSIW